MYKPATFAAGGASTRVKSMHALLTSNIGFPRENETIFYDLIYVIIYYPKFYRKKNQSNFSENDPFDSLEEFPNRNIFLR